MAQTNRRVLPGFRLSIGFTLVYLSVMVVIPLVGCFIKAGSLTWPEFRDAVWTERGPLMN